MIPARSAKEGAADAFKALLKSDPDPIVADRIADLRDKFHDAFTGWLKIEEAA